MKNLGLVFAAGLTFACSAELGPSGAYEGDDRSQIQDVTASLPETTAPAAAENVVPVEEVVPEGISFGSDKWLDPEGTETATVGGLFPDYQVSFNRPFTSLDDLGDLEITVGVDIGSLDTGSIGRDINILEAYFESAAFPKATATFYGFEEGALPNAPLPAGDVQGLTREFIVSMDLEMRGTVQHHDNIRISIMPEGTAYRVRTVTPIPIRADIGMPVAALLLRCNHFGISAFAPTEVNILVTP